jgi:hypothetical protein
MAEHKGAEVKKKGFFSRKKSAPATVPIKTPQAAIKAPAAPKPAAAPLPVEPRLSLESMPEVEKRIDRMHATARRASLMARYESKYGEKLEVPAVFVAVEEEKPESSAPADAGAPAPAAPTAAKPAQASPGASKPAAAPVAEKTAAPALPPKDVKLSEAKLFAAAAKPAPPAAEKLPEAAKPSKPSPINLKSFWKYLWPYWRLPLRALAKYNSPESKGKILAATIFDIPVWILLAVPRIVLCPIGLAVDLLKKRKAKQANGEKAEAAVAVN